MSTTRNLLLGLMLGMSTLVAGETLATVNGKKITTEDAEQFMKAGRNPAQTFEKAAEKEKKIIIDQLVERELFLDAAKKAKLEKDPELTKDIERVSEVLLINHWIKKQHDAVVVSDSEAKEFYAKNKKEFKRHEQVRARHILLKEKESGEALLKELRALSGEKLTTKFIELAKAKSTGPTGPKGGDLGFFSKGQMVPEFDKAVFLLKKGQITQELVKTRHGYHIILLEERKASSMIPYEQIKSRILQSLKQKQFSTMIQETAKGLREKADVVISGAEKK